MRQQTIYTYLRNEQPRREPEPFEDCERVVVVGPDGVPAVFVVLSMLEVGSEDYAMLAREDELLDTEDGDMSVYLFQHVLDEHGQASFAMIEDDDVYSDVFQLFSALTDVDDDEPELWA